MKKILAIVTLSALLFSCGQPDKRQELTKLIAQRDALNEQIKQLQVEIAANDTTDKKTKKVLLTSVTTAPFNHYIQIQGHVDGDKNIDITPKMSGIIVSKFVSEGETVSKGQLIAQIDDAIYQQQLKAAQVNLAYASESFEKLKRLWEQKIGSEDTYLRAKAGKESAEYNIKALKEQIDMCRITAPIAGTVEDFKIKVGQMVSPASPKPICKIANFEKLKIVAEVSEAYANKVNQNDKSIVLIPDLKEEFPSTLTYVSKFINAVNRTFTIESEMGSSNKNIKANMVCVIKINDYSTPNAIAIPLNIVQYEGDMRYVFVAKNVNGKKMAKKTPITLGLNYNGITEITTGLNPGDQLITTGYQDMVDQQVISF